MSVKIYSEGELIQDINSDGVTQSPDFKFNIAPANHLHRLLQQVSWLPKTKTLRFYPFVLYKLGKASTIALDINLADYSRQRWMADDFKLVKKYKREACILIAMASSPSAFYSKRLARTLQRSLTPVQIIEGIEQVITKMNMKDFKRVVKMLNELSRSYSSNDNL